MTGRELTYQSSEVIPDLREEGIETDCPRVRVKGIPVLVDLVIEDSNRAPEMRVPTVTIDGLLIRLVRLGVLLLRHVAAAQEIPALGIQVVRGDGSLEILNGLLLASEAVAQLVKEPTQLLQHLGMVRVKVQHALISGLCAVVLLDCQQEVVKWSDPLGLLWADSRPSVARRHGRSGTICRPRSTDSAETGQCT